MGLRCSKKLLPAAAIVLAVHIYNGRLGAAPAWVQGTGTDFSECLVATLDMNVNKVWDYYDDRIQKTGDLVRQLSYAGFAVIWILRPADGKPFDPRMVFAALFLVVTLTLDTFQHVVVCYRLRALAKGKEAKCK